MRGCPVPIKGAQQVAANRLLWTRAGFLVRRLHQINVSIFLGQFEDWNITPNQWGVLTVVSVAPGLSHTEIATQCGIDRVNVRDIVIRLEEKGLVSQSRSKGDRRQACAFITKQGQSLLRQLEPNLRRTQEILLKPLKPEEQETFLALLRRLVIENSELSRTPVLLPSDSESEGSETTANRLQRKRKVAR